MGHKLKSALPPLKGQKTYRKPLFRRKKGIDFVLEEINTQSTACRQCSSCHGCR